jgi:hypothetical protein
VFKSLYYVVFVGSPLRSHESGCKFIDLLLVIMIRVAGITIHRIKK